MVVKAGLTSRFITEGKYYKVEGLFRNSYLIYTDKGNKQLIDKNHFKHKRKYDFMFWV